MRTKVGWWMAVAWLGACGGETLGDPEAQALQVAVKTTIDFENVAPGPLAAPWTVTKAGASTIAVVATPGPHGHVLQLDGSKRLGEFLLASVATPTTSGDLTATVDVLPSDGAAFVYVLRGGGGYGLRAHQLRLFRMPDSDVLWAGAADGNRACGTLASGRWSTVQLVVHAATPRTFDVSVDGVAGCVDAPLGLQPPFGGVTVMDASNDGWGGRVWLDDIALR